MFHMVIYIALARENQIGDKGNLTGG